MTEPATPPHAQPPDPMQRPARLALYLGIALLLAGGVVMYLGYNGAATNPIPAAQTPFVISGGLFGAALLVLGGIALVVHVLVQVQAEVRRDMGVMRESLESLAEAVSHQLFGVQASPPSTNGHSTVFVVRGASSFHRGECRLVERAEHTRALPRVEAEDSGLAACRICKP